MPRLLAAAAFLLISFGPPEVTRPRTLTFDDRVAAQRAIEEVYWRQRIWPDENPTPKPPLSVVMSDDAIRAKVSDYLKKSNALETYWLRPITADQLQAEMDRMASRTTAGDVLLELFAALGNDPFVIAETLGRQALADRQTRSWYKNDERFHGAVRRRAQDALARSPRLEDLKGSGAVVSETTWKLDPSNENEPYTLGDSAEILLGATEWRELVLRLATSFGTVPDPEMDSPGLEGRPLIPTESMVAEIPTLKIGVVEAKDEAFVATAVLEKGPDRLKLVSFVWPKTSFDTWWQEKSSGIGSSVRVPTTTYRAVAPRTDSGCVDDTWREVYSDWPHPRADHSAVWTGTEMIVWGGSTFQGPQTEGSRYRPLTDVWVPISSEGGPVNPSGHSAIWTGREMIVWGGSAATSGRYDPVHDSWRPISDAGSPSETGPVVWTGAEMIVWNGAGGRYNPRTDSWRPVSSAGAPSSRLGSTAVWTGGEMIVWGGKDSSGTYLNSGARYDPRANRWSTTAMTNAPTVRAEHSAVWTGSEMIVWGGADAQYGPRLGSGARYDPRTDVWAPMSAFSARARHTAVWTGREMVVWGGTQCSDCETSTGGRYDPATDTWTPTGASNLLQRQRHTAVWTGNEMIVWGGLYFVNYEYLDNGARYDPRTDTWVPTSTGTSPENRQLHTAVWTGSEMIVWQGLLYGGTIEWCPQGRPGGSYEPATDRWLPLPMPPEADNPCGGAWGHSAVWTGREMIVWGGKSSPYFHFEPFSKSGFRFNPGTYTWTRMNETTAPVGRGDHTAVWTGRGMIVWGGRGGSGPMNTGALYDPQQDSWAPTATTNAPDARTDHTAVWTSDRMIVWGGRRVPYEASTNTGGVYDPLSDSWLPTAVVNAPPAAAEQAAVGAGREMIVWGGCGASCPTETGGRYEPVNGAWTPVSSPGFPLPLKIPTAVWTGDEMIVWQGTGGRYDPSRDQWRPASPAGIDTTREYHTAVWTGREMIVWGGIRSLYSSSVAGARYCACSTPTTFFLDADGDGSGDPSGSVAWCGSSPPDGYASSGGDCNDADPRIHPGTPEACNGIDDNCDGRVDEDTQGVDSDGDGIRNACDACTTSIASATVVIDGCQTGVPNYRTHGVTICGFNNHCGHGNDASVDGGHGNGGCRHPLAIGGDGCNVADLIQRCRQVSACPSKFVECVELVTKALKKQHILSEQQRKKIRRCVERGV